MLNVTSQEKSQSDQAANLSACLLTCSLSRCLRGASIYRNAAFRSQPKSEPRQLRRCDSAAPINR
jgi:hypothetical protein